jgi:hypothetical protein
MGLFISVLVCAEAPFAGLSVEEHYQQNLAAMQALLGHENTSTKRVELKTVVRANTRKRRRASRGQTPAAFSSEEEGGRDEEIQREIITKPSASGVRSTVMHPLTYRDLHDIPTVGGLAHALNVAEWSGQAELVRSNPLVVDSWRRFHNVISTESEPVVSSEFNTLMRDISRALGVGISPKSERRFGVGGILALGQYALCGKTDLTYVVEGRSAPLCRAHGVEIDARDRNNSTQSDAAMVLTV